MKLSEEQLRAVYQYVDSSSIQIETLRDDMLDHLCCSIESKLDQGKSFEDSLLESSEELAPQGLAALEYETILLLNSKNIVMKKFMYLTGLFTTIAMTMGITMKLLHMPGSEELFNAGFLGFALIFLPLIAIKQWRSKVPRPTVDKLRTILGFISTVGVGISVLLKISFQLEWSSNALLISAGIFCFGFLPCLFYSMYSKELKSL